MTILSDTDISGFIPYLYYAAEKKISPQEQKQLYWMLNTTVTHLRTIQDEERFANIRTNVLQQFKSQQPSSHKRLIQWICKHSVKLSNGDLYGPIIPLIDFFKTLGKPKQETESQCSALSIVRDIDFEFYPLKHEKSLRERVEYRKNLEKTLGNIYILLKKWKEITTIPEHSLTTKKNGLFTDTENMLVVLKEKAKEDERNKDTFIADLNLVISQQTEIFKNYPWEKISAWISANSFSEYEGAYQLFDDFMRLIFGIHSLPTQYFQEKDKALKQINLNKKNGKNFSKIVHFEGLRQIYFQEWKILNRILKVSKIERSRAISELIPLINEGVITNLTLGLHSIEDLIEFFGQENCQKITHLEFNVNPQINPQSNSLLNHLFQYFPKIKHLSLYDCHLNKSNEESIKSLKTLECLKLIDYKNITWEAFPSELILLKELELSHIDDCKMNLSNLLQYEHLKKFKCTVNLNDNNADVIEKLARLESLHLICNLNRLNFLDPLKKLKELIIEGQFNDIDLSQFPFLTHLKISSNNMCESISLRNLPLLMTLNLKNASSMRVKIDNLPELKEVNLGNLIITTSELEKSTKISKLSFRNLVISHDLQWILKYPLEFLNITDRAICLKNMKLLKNLSKLKELRLDILNYLLEEEISDLHNTPSLKKIIINESWLSERAKKNFRNKGIEIVNNDSLIHRKIWDN